ncbi:uncharacterized protein LOC129767055 [Toxorhynchites rutilus septentrionalis]|uniref:uncharacterized protein LOC129767055 n=1 Tax=Toxorhynchites rutilus septentrionalis TaxID=329112 RepID=UPI00247988E4|nr:uncharacterized protein LOC129767055 [Toxorhynchites rutilus septentrionalis]
MDIFQNQCTESLGFDSMLAANPINSPLQSTDSPTHLNFSNASYFTSIPSQPSNAAVPSTNGPSLPPICHLTSNNYSSSSGPNDVVLPSIFVKVPMQINQQYQQQNQQSRSSNPAEIKCEDKSEPIKRELGDLRALEKGTAMVQLPSIAESYLAEDRQEQRDDELVVHCCECCPFITIVEQSLRDHVRTKHQSAGEGETSEPLHCPACANKFRQRSSLEVHLLDDHMMVRSEMRVLMEHKFPAPERDEATTSCNTVPQEHVLVSESPQAVIPEQNKSRIYIKNVQLLKKPDVIEKENVQQAQQHHAEQQQQHQQQQHQQQNGKIFIRNVSLLQNANFVQNVDNVFRNASGLHESKYSFVVPTPSPNCESPPISVSEPLSGTSQRSKIFIRNVDILRNPLLPVTPPITSTCDMSRTSSSESLYTTPPPPVVSPAASVISIGGSSMGSSGLNMVLLPTPICSSNSSTPPISATSPVVTVTSSESIHSQPAPRKSKIFIKNISVLKQPTIHLKSVDELNLMTIDQLQFQNLLPTSSTTQNMENGDMPVDGEHQSMEEDFGNILNDSVADLEDFNGVDAQYEELQVCDTTCGGGVSQQEAYQSQFDSDFIIIEPGSTAENVAYDGSVEPLRIAAPPTDIIDHHQQQPQALPEPSVPPDSQQYHQTDEDILFVCAEEIINLDPPMPQDKNATEQTITHTIPPAISQAPSAQPQQQQPPPRIYVSGNLMEHHSPPAPSNHISPHPTTSISTPIAPLNKVEEIKIDEPSGSNSEQPQTSTSTTHSAEKDRTRNRGRPKGAKQTGITKLKKLYTNLTPLEEGYKCDLADCGARFKQPETLMYHKKCHVPPTESISPDTVRCPECGSQEFRSWNTLHTHLWREHSVDMELYSCHLCNFKTPVLCRLNNTHMKIHSDEKNFICAICDKAFKNNKQLRNHRRSHRDHPRGQQTTSQDKQQSDGSSDHPKQHSSLPVNCVKCGLKFSNQKTLKAHVESRHVSDGGAVEGRMRCSICGMVFKTRYLLQSHVAKHSDEKKFKCDHCDYSTNDHNAIRRHKMRHNSNGHMYSCSYCDYTSIQSTTYRKHLERLHADVASNLLYKCSKCTFVSISGLKYQLHRAKHVSSEDNPTGESECHQATVEPLAPSEPQPADEEQERLCESVNSDVVIVDKDPAEPPLDAFSLIPPSITDHHHQFPLQPMIRPAGFANNLSKVDNFYGYPSSTSLDNASLHYQQQPGGQVSSQNENQLMPQQNGEASVPVANSSGTSGSHQHEYYSNSVLHSMGTMAPVVGCSESTHGN